MNRRTLLQFTVHGAILAPAASLLMAACSTVASPTPTAAPASGASPAASPATALSGTGGTLVIGMTAGNIPYPNTPPNEGAEGSRFVGYNIYDALTRLNVEQGTTTPVPSPGLAESWKIGEDKLTWTFNLRKGVKFHDGTDFNANAVVFQLARLIKKDFKFYDPLQAAATASFTMMIDSYQAIDPQTVQIKTKVPYSFLLWDLLLIMFPSPAAVQKYGVKDYVNHPIGTGPFFVTKYVDGQIMELAPNPNYWRGKPKLDKMILRPMPDPAARLAALESGGINWAEVPPPDSLAQLKAQGYKILLKTYPHSIVLDYNLSKPPFNNQKARVALQYAIDRNRMCNDLLDKACTPAYQWMYTGHPWYDPTIGDKYQYDPTKAKQLLKEAGYPNGFKINVAYPTGGSGNMWPGPMMELVQSNFKDVGVTMTMTPLEWNDILTIYRAGFNTPENRKYDAMYFSPNTSSPPSLLGFATSRIQPNGCCNVTGYSNPKVDALFQQAESEFDTKKQDSLLREAMGIVTDDSPVAFVVHDLNLRVLSSQVHGFVQPMSWYCDFLNVWVSK